METQVAERVPAKPAASGGLVILTPVYNDWAALAVLIRELDTELTAARNTARLVVVDDGSSKPADARLEKSLAVCTALTEVCVLTLRRNLGHQRAIAVGLAYVEANLPGCDVVVMDSDGEDRPSDVPRLIRQSRIEADQPLVFAERSQRSEGLLFRASYVAFRSLHRTLTGQSVRFGNFSFVPAKRVSCLVACAELWNHYAASVVKARIPFVRMPTRRGKRYDGQSKMNWVQLVIHGLSAISVHGDVAGVRLLVVASMLVLASLAGLAATVTVRLTTDLAVPGWATTAAGICVLAMSHAILLLLAFSFLVLSNRQAAMFLPLRDYSHFVKDCARIWPQAMAAPEANVETAVLQAATELADLAKQASDSPRGIVAPPAQAQSPSGLPLSGLPLSGMGRFGLPLAETPTSALTAERLTF